MLVHHHVFPPDPREHLSRAWNAGGFATLVREVPELRDVFLRNRVLLGSPVRLPLYGAAVAALLGRRRAAALGVATWAGLHAAALRGANGSPRRRLASLPVILAHDAVTAVSLVAGSVRSRTVVL